MREWSKTWKASKQPGKQRKYRKNAPLHIKRKFLAVNLTKELQKKYKRRSALVRKGDKVRILRGENKKKTGKILKVDTTKGKVFVEGIEQVRKDGTRTQRSLEPSKIQIIELELNDQKRKNALEKSGGVK